MRRYLKIIWQLVFVRLLRVAEWMSYRLPHETLLRVATLFGILAFHASGRYRGVAMKNLDLAYGATLTRAEKIKITRGVFINFSKSSMEFPLASRMSQDEIRGLVDFRPEDAEMLRELEREHGSFLGISAHFGNFELMARRYVAEGFVCSVVVRNDNNPAIAQLLNDYRIRTGYGVIPRGAAIRTVLKKLRGSVPETVVMLPDQKSDDIFVPFFGKLAGTVAGPAVIALRAGCPIVPVFCVRLQDDRHKLVFGEIIRPSGVFNSESDIEQLMTQINLAIETMVRAHPDQWLWLHDRWRVKPPPEVLQRLSQPVEAVSEMTPV